MKERILLSVEDSDAEYFIIKMALKEYPSPVRICRVPDGEEALLFLRGDDKYQDAPTPNLILMNLNLPRKSGLEILAEIRQFDYYRHIPIVIFTSSSDESERKKALAMGAEDFITKPSTLDALIETLGNVCSRLMA